LSNIINFTGVTSLDSDADRAINSAIGELDAVVIVGINKDGSEYFSSSIASGAECLWMLERAKMALLNIVDEQ